MASKLDTLEVVDVPDRATWRAWLETHHTQPAGIWLTLYKKESGQRLMTYADAVEEALCFGWIDSHPRKVNAACFRLLFSPRKPKSVWSAVNKQRIAQLREAGLMRAAGEARITIAQQNGSWEALDEVEALVVPADLTAALEANAAAQQHFSSFPPSARKQLLQNLAAARRPETRQQRIERIVANAAQNRRG
jgi:uncharacterized protein YdeI (YjbR/CyaY-like superfamily)